MGKDLRGKNLGVGLSQRKDGYYSARYCPPSGKRIERYFKTPEEASAWLKGARLSSCGVRTDDSVDMTVDFWFDYWMKNIKEKTVRPNTVRNHYERYNRNIKKHLGGMSLYDVKPMHCQMVLNNMYDDYAGSTINQCLQTMYAMFQAAYENGLIVSNPVTKSVVLPKPIEKKIRFMTVGEQRLFIQQAEGSALYPQYFMILNTGLRTGELIGLKWEDIDFKEKILSVSRSMEYRYSTQKWMEGPPKTKNAYRDIPLTKECLKMLKAIKKEHDLGRKEAEGFEEYVFLCRKGTPVKNSTYDAHLEKITEKAGIQKISMHTLRHTFATRCIEAGMRPKTLQQILGHSSINITMNLYVHVSNEEKFKEMHKLEGYYVNQIGV